MNKQFVTYEIALKLKELGFNEGVCAYYKGKPYSTDGTEGKFCWYGELDGHGNWLIVNNDSIVAAPLWQQVIDWLVDVHKYHIEPTYGDYAKKWAFQLNAVNGGRKPPFRSDYIYNYSEVKIHAILKALELINK